MLKVLAGLMFDMFYNDKRPGDFMKLQQKHRSYLTLSILGLLLLFNFQNCGQPGSINVSSKDDVVDLSTKDPAVDPVTTKAPEADSTNNTTTSTTIPVSTMPTPVYKTFEKTLSVNETLGKVDVLVVIDNSGSMNYEQLSMSKRFGSFIDKLKGLDWQVGIVTTDMDKDTELRDGRLVKFNSLNKYLISSSDDLTAAKSAFAAAIQRPANEGSGLEQGIKATYRALERSSSSATLSVTVSGDTTTYKNNNIGLIREGASLAVIVVTDADETSAVSSTGVQLAGDEKVFTDKNFPKSLFNYVSTQYPAKPFKYSGIIVKPEDSACRSNRASFTTASGSTLQNSNEGYGDHYKQLIDLTGGVMGDVCATDYDSQLKIIGQNSTDAVKDVLLDCAPVDSDKNGRIDVVVQDLISGAELTNYVVAGNKITFDQLLAVSKYKINYRCLEK